MMRSSVCLRFMHVVVLVLVVLMAAPLAGADDYDHLFSSGKISAAQENASIAVEDDDSDSHLCCPCMICMECLGELSPTVAPPEGGTWKAHASLDFVSSMYHPEILRPPIS